MEIGVILKILLAAMLGGIIGLERELAHKEAGLRTNILIAVGSALITILSFKIAAQAPAADPARLAAQIVTGIGFLGAGAIIQARFAVHGLTTAATIWTVAAIGIAVGGGFTLLAFLVTLLVVLVLTAFRFLLLAIERQKQNCVYVITTEEKASLLVEMRRILTELNIRASSSRLNRRPGAYEFEIIFTTSEIKNREFLDKVMMLEGVQEVLSENL